MKVDEIVKELSRKYNKKEKVIQAMLKKHKELEEDMEKFVNSLKEFYGY